MIFQIAMGIFFGFLFLAVFAGVILGIAYIISRNEEPEFLKKPRTKTSIQDWWDRYDEEDDY